MVIIGIVAGGWDVISLHALYLGGEESIRGELV